MTKQTKSSSNSDKKESMNELYEKLDLKNIKSFLFDLDNTLIKLNEKELSNAIFAKMATFFPELEQEKFIHAVTTATIAMIQSDGSKLLAKVFEEKFAELTGYPKEDILSKINKFYATDLPKFKKYIQPRKKAIEIVKRLIKADKEVVIATNPLLGSVAQQVRLDWLELNLDKDRAPILITSAEEFNFSKPRVEYYQQLIDTLQRDPKEMLMIGDSLTHDIIPAKAAELKTYLITDIEPDHLQTFGDFAPNIELKPDAEGPLEKIYHAINDLLQSEESEKGKKE